MVSAKIIFRLTTAFSVKQTHILSNFPLRTNNLKSFRRYTTATMPAGTFKNQDQIKNVHNNIIKSEGDKRQYRGLELNNGMKILLISDPTTDKSSAALDVHIGAMSDPTSLPGLAHFLEHMLFLGTEKYPCENEYSKFLSLHAGSSNAYTAGDHTNYFFDVAPEHLTGALDRFAQFFLAPMFTESATDREVKAVNSEHEKNIQSDVWRFNQLGKSLSDPNHDFNKFSTGNIKTLDEIPKNQGINVRKELLGFHKKWYSSNIMALAVLGKEGLDELTELVLEHFPAVENKNVQIPEWNSHPFREEDLRIKTLVVPVKDVRSVTITFPTPDFHAHYKTNPGHYLGHLICHEGPGSLLSELKAKGWVSSLYGGELTGGKGFAFFTIKCDLTEEGIDHVDDITSLLFEYLNLLKKEGSKEWVFNECKALAEMMFRFKDKEDPLMYTPNLSTAIHNYPLKEVLSGQCLIEEFKPELIESLLSKLTPENIRVFIVGKKFEPEANQTEKWYGTKYKSEPIDYELIDSWKMEKLNDKLKLPKKNEFIPTNFDIVEREKEPSSFPVLIKNTHLSKLWFMQDNQFLFPKSIMKVHFTSPLAFSDPLNSGLTDLFVRLFEDSLTEYSYDAQLTGLFYSFINMKSGLILNLRGYSHKLDIFLEKIMECMTSFEVDPKRFEIFKEKYIRKLRNFGAEQPYQQTIFHADVLLSQRSWTKEDLLQVCDEITCEKLKSFIPELLSKMNIECICYGNLTQQKSLEMISVVEQMLQDRMKTKHLHPVQLIGDRQVQLPSDCNLFFEHENTVHNSSCTQTYYQFGQQSTKTNAIADLHAQIISEPCFDILRTKEQLGYIVFSGTRYSNGAIGLNVLVQSECKPSYLDGRIESFLNSMEDFIKNMSDEDFERNKTSLSEKKLEKAKNLFHQGNKFWLEIVSNQYNFDRENIEVEVLKSITKEELLKFHQKFISPKSTERKKLCVQVLSTCKSDSKFELPQQEGLAPVPELPKPNVVNDIPAFKCSVGLLPIMKPAIHIPKPTDMETKSKL